MTGPLRGLIAMVLLASMAGACTSSVPGSPAPTVATPTFGLPPTARPTATPEPTRSPIPSEAPSPSPGQGEPVVDPDALPVYLSGPFGTLDGIATTGGWPAASDLWPLDAFVESAPLVMGFRDRDLEAERWTLSLAPAHDPGDATAETVDEGPSPGERRDLAVFDGPVAGEWVSRADVDPANGDPAAYHWRLIVPDRPFPADGIVAPPIPDLVVDRGGDAVTAILGSSCYVSICADAPRPPLRLLPVLEVPAGDRMRLTLSDGSGFVAWVVATWPSDQLDREPDEVDRGDDEAGVTMVEVAAPSGGDRLVSVSLRFDLERGDAVYYLRVRESAS